jgi:antitoxin (DNA-binding transcriptional repressor) of toxin-antitoxin stability system
MMSKDEVVNIYEAKTNLSKLCGQAAGGHDVVLARHGQPWVRITMLEKPQKKIVFGVLKDEVAISDDFDSALPPEILGSFEGD